MGTKTISLKNEAYARLKAARRFPSESFSEVVLRATWPEDTTTGRELLAWIRKSPSAFDVAELAAIDRALGADRPPEDKWPAR